MFLYKESIGYRSDFSLYLKGVFFLFLKSTSMFVKDLFPGPSRKITTTTTAFYSIKGHNDWLLGRLRYIGNTTFTQYLFQHKFPLSLLQSPLSPSFLPSFCLSNSQRFFFSCLHTRLNFLFQVTFFFFSFYICLYISVASTTVVWRF